MSISRSIRRLECSDTTSRIVSNFHDSSFESDRKRTARSETTLVFPPLSARVKTQLLLVLLAGMPGRGSRLRSELKNAALAVAQLFSNLRLQPNYSIAKYFASG